MSLERENCKKEGGKKEGRREGGRERGMRGGVGFEAVVGRGGEERRGKERKRGVLV